jgi:hypothetical protein
MHKLNLAMKDELGFEEEPMYQRFCINVSGEKVQMLLGFEPVFTIDRSIPISKTRHDSFQKRSHNKEFY